MKKTDEEFDPWTLFVLNLNAQIRMTPILDLPYQLIMKLMNIFIFLNYTIEIYIHDSDDSSVEYYNNSSTKTSIILQASEIANPNHLGGFGLMNPNHQVKVEEVNRYIFYTHKKMT